VLARNVASNGSTVTCTVTPSDGMANGAPVVVSVLVRDTNAQVTFRNAGSNPASYVAQPVSLGASWDATVNVAATAHTHATVLGYTGSQTFALPGGQVLLVGGAKLFQLPLQAGPTAAWSISIPSDPALVGMTFHTQAAHLFGASPFALTNAQDLYVGA